MNTAPYTSAASSDPDPHDSAFRQQVEADWPATLAAYDRLPLAHGGKVIEADIARSLYAPYAASPAGAREHTASTGRVAAKVYQKRLDAALAAARPGDVFIWFAGGPASGKSTRAQLLARDPEVARVVDGIFGGEFFHHRNRLLKALKRGVHIEFHYVFRPAHEAMSWMHSRAARIGRFVPAEAMSRLHWEAQQNVARLLAELPAITPVLINNADAASSRINRLDTPLLENFRYPAPPDIAGLAALSPPALNPPIRSASSTAAADSSSDPFLQRAVQAEAVLRASLARGEIIPVP